jgi:sugar O-acyltransferase (sialic acid O-acetyltransferase NeuD family)
MANTYLFGASGHGKVIKEILNANGVKVEAFIDDNLAVDECAGRKVLHEYDGLSPVIVSIGVNRIRKIVVEKLEAKAIANGNELEFTTAIHPTAIVSPTAKIGKGTVIMAGAVINADAVIGEHCIINTGATVDHDCVIGDYCHIAPGVNISGATNIGSGTWVGVGSCVIQCLNIGQNCMIGAGSVVVKDIPDNVVAYGNPCKVIRNNE